MVNILPRQEITTITHTASNAWLTNYFQFWRTSLTGLQEKPKTELASRWQKRKVVVGKPTEDADIPELQKTMYATIIS